MSHIVTKLHVLNKSIIEPATIYSLGPILVTGIW